jgi:hypothetical protein
MKKRPKLELGKILDILYEIKDDVFYFKEYGKDLISSYIKQEQNKKMHTALETAISLLKQTTEYEVLDSWKEKVKELEQLINKI